MARPKTGKPAAPAADVQRPSAEVLYADELDSLARDDGDAPRPKGWALTPRSVLTFVLGDERNGAAPKFVGRRAFLERCIVALGYDQALTGLALTAEREAARNDGSCARFAPSAV